MGISAIAGGHDQGHGNVKVTQLPRRDIHAKIDGKADSATVVEVAFGPGQKDTPHRHAGSVFGCVLEGEYEHAIDDVPVKTYRAGETFYEPSGCMHRVARKPEQPEQDSLASSHPASARSQRGYGSVGRQLIGIVHLAAARCNRPSSTCDVQAEGTEQ